MCDVPGLQLPSTSKNMRDSNQSMELRDDLLNRMLAGCWMQTASMNSLTSSRISVGVPHKVSL